MSYEPSEEQFLKDVAAHKMTVLRDDGLYRHVEFRGPHGWHHWFEIVTWPNALVIRGDMKTWCFSRVEDMFTFFRGDKISPRYWQEKLQCARNDAKRFSIEALKRDAIGAFDNYDAEELTPEMREQIAKKLDEEIFSTFGDHDQHQALTALYDFNRPSRGVKRQHPVTYDSCDGPHGLEWDYHYIWCCRAIVWGIAQYDKAKEAAQ